jgi:hypothetical protein
LDKYHWTIEQLPPVRNATTNPDSARQVRDLRMLALKIPGRRVMSRVFTARTTGERRGM